jgi:putative ABC transport system permease protein
MSRLLGRAGRRHLTRHPWQLMLCILGVALGVAVVVAIDLTNSSAERAFQISMETVSGRATHQIVGGQAGVDESLYVQFKRNGMAGHFAPVVEGQAAVVDGGRIVRILGIDPFAEAPFRAYLGGIFESGGVPIVEFLTSPKTGVLTASTAERAGVGVDEMLELRIGTRRQSIRLLGLLKGRTEREQQALGDLLIVDIATAQSLLGQQGRLTRIDWIAPEVESEQQLSQLEATLPQGLRLQRTEGKTRAMESMTRAFRLNLTALSMLAMIVGMFLIYNAMTFAVVQRRGQIGILRAIGVTRRQIAISVLREAAWIGLVGSLLGTLLGIALGSGLIRLVTTTINDLYFLLSVRALALSPLILAKGVGLGVITTIIAALIPAREAASAAPRMTMLRSHFEAASRQNAGRLALCGLITILAGSALLALATESLALSFVGVFGFIIGCAFSVPWITIQSITLFRPLLASVAGTSGAMAARGVVSTLSRTGVAIAALMIAVSVTVGVGIMIDSFRKTVIDWLGSSLIADVYVSPPDLTVGNSGARLEPDLVDLLRSVPGARAEATVRRADVPSADGSATILVAIGGNDETRPVYELIDGSFESQWPAFRDAEGVFVSEPYAKRFRVTRGDSLTLLTDSGERPFQILGIYRDFSSDQGVVAIHRSGYLQHWDDQELSGIAFFLEPGTEIAAFMDALGKVAGAGRELQIRSNRAIREEAIVIFNRTFTITSVLRLLAVVVAFVGVLSALMALQLERSREFGVLRAIGLTPRQVWQLITLQTSLMGLIAGLLAVPVGLALAWIMIRIINLRAFGWTLTISLHPTLLLQAIGLATLAALLAGLYPARSLSRISPAEALREE